MRRRIYEDDCVDNDDDMDDDYEPKIGATTALITTLTATSTKGVTIVKRPKRRTCLVKDIDSSVNGRAADDDDDEVMNRTIEGSPFLFPPPPTLPSSPSLSRDRREEDDEEEEAEEAEGEEELIENNGSGSNDDGSPCICEFCGRTFKAAMNLRVHVRNVHIRVRKFKCDQCDKEFVTRYLLQEHAQADHEGMPSHLCPICGKG